MTISELRDRFNQRATEADFSLRIIRIVEPEGEQRTGRYILHRNLSGVYQADESGQIVSVHLMMTPKAKAEAMVQYTAACLLLDCMTGFTLKRRNKIMGKLGLHTGKFVERVRDGGYIFGAAAVQSGIMVTVAGVPGEVPPPPPLAPRSPESVKRNTEQLEQLLNPGRPASPGMAGQRGSSGSAEPKLAVLNPKAKHESKDN